MPARKDTEVRRKIIAAAVQLALTKGRGNYLRRDVAKRAHVATGTVSYHYGTMGELRRAVMAYAIQNEVLEIIAQGLAEKHPLVLKASEDLQRRAARCLVA